MNINPKLRPILYGTTVYVIYLVLTFLLKYFTHKTPFGDEWIGIYTKNDLLIGLAVALVVTYTHEQKKRLK